LYVFANIRPPKIDKKGAIKLIKRTWAYMNIIALVKICSFLGIISAYLLKKNVVNINSCGSADRIG
tara:strand:- start:188 stop:385 length:198 start_codon:yes stop_codon:yes gene_type:complete